MNICSHSTSPFGAGTVGRIPFVVSLMVGAFLISLWAVPGTVLANSATDQYTEPEIPKVPHDPNRGSDGRDGFGAGERNGKNGSSSSRGALGRDRMGGTGSGLTAEQEMGDDGVAEIHDSDDEAKQSEGAIAALGGPPSDGGGGSAAMLVLAWFIGVPLAVGAGIALHRRRIQSRSAEVKRGLQLAMGGRYDEPSGKE